MGRRERLRRLDEQGLLIHLATGHVARIGCLEAALAGRDAVVVPDVDAGNEHNVAAWRPAPIEAVVAEMLATRSRVLDLLEKLEPHHLDARFDRDARPTRLAAILATFSSHDLDHATQLRLTLP